MLMVTFPDILLLSSPKLIHLYMVLLLHLLEIIFPGARILQYWQQFMTFSLLEQFAERKIGSRVFLQDTLLQNIRVFISLERFSFCLFLFCNLMEIDGAILWVMRTKLCFPAQQTCVKKNFHFAFPVTNQSSTDESSMAETAVCCNVDDFFYLHL